MGEVDVTTVSVIIPIYNNESMLRLCLDSIRQSSVVPDETILVDDGSHDNSACIAKEYDCTLIELGSNMGVGYARNVGAHAASGEVLFFTDGDVELQVDTLEKGLDYLASHASAAAVVGSYTEKCGQKTFTSHYKNAVNHHLHMESPERLSIFFGACGLVWTKVFKSVGGFTTEGRFARILEDADFGNKLYAKGHEIHLLKGMQVTHHKKYSLGSMLYSDFFKRAIPWTILILRNKVINFELATRGSDLVRMALAYSIVALVIAAAIGVRLHPTYVLAATVAFIWSDRRLLYFLRTHYSMGFAVKGVGMRFLHYVLSGIGAATGAAIEVSSRICQRIPVRYSGVE